MSSVESIGSSSNCDDETMLRRLKKRFNESKYDEVVTIMKQHSGVFDIIRMKDKKSFTILHRMVLH